MASARAPCSKRITSSLPRSSTLQASVHTSALIAALHRDASQSLRSAGCWPRCSSDGDPRRSNSLTTNTLFGCGSRQRTRHAPVRIPSLTKNGRDDFPIGIPATAVRRRTVGLDGLVQLREGMERHHREHMVLYVVVHVPVEEAREPAHVNRATVEAVIEDIFGQTRVLSESIEGPEEATINCRQTNEHCRKDGVRGEATAHHRPENAESRACTPGHFPAFRFRNKGALLCCHATAG